MLHVKFFCIVHKVVDSCNWWDKIVKFNIFVTFYKLYKNLGVAVIGKYSIFRLSDNSF